MESIIRAVCIYLFLLFIMRIAGARTLSEMTAFDFVLLLIIGDASQQAVVGEDYSLTGGIIIITTLVLLDVWMSFIKTKWNFFDKLLEGSPLIIVNNGKLRKKFLKYIQVDVFDILEAARERQGLERIDQIKFAILEKGGQITIIPYSQSKHLTHS